ncbi:MAG TPA: methyltransferase domain-containing protein [Nocardioidaceae bacterium]|jgi:ubiquinone/menaquinone biosynthesis C-methylase UbiE|nr:methyltransferase domain-containing protein [Nocardioidaceae bacterium]
MSPTPSPWHDAVPSRSFDLVADAYDRGRPTYPREAADWLVGRPHARVLELGAGTGKLTEQLLALGHTVTATDPSEVMLDRLARRAPEATRLAATAEEIPLASKSFDVVVAAQAFHWFDVARALPEIARMLAPGGHLAVVWNTRDERIPWVRRLGALIGGNDHETDPTAVIDESAMFETVESKTFRFWQPLTPDSLRDLVTSRSYAATMSDLERTRLLDKVGRLYDEYGRGADGLLLPYLTSAYRATVLPWAVPEEPAAPPPPDDVDPDALLIDFR